MYILITHTHTYRRVTLPIFLFVRVFPSLQQSVVSCVCVIECVIHGVRIIYACPILLYIRIYSVDHF